MNSSKAHQVRHLRHCHADSVKAHVDNVVHHLAHNLAIPLPCGTSTHTGAGESLHAELLFDQWHEHLAFCHIADCRQSVHISIHVHYLGEGLAATQPGAAGADVGLHAKGLFDHWHEHKGCDAAQAKALTSPLGPTPHVIRGFLEAGGAAC